MRNRLLGCWVLGYFNPSGSSSRTKMTDPMQQAGRVLRERG